jgi:RHS repeat-associated protein
MNRNRLRILAAGASVALFAHTTVSAQAVQNTTTNYVYSQGKLYNSTSAIGQVTTYSYDPLNRVKQVQLPNPFGYNTAYVQYGFDGIDQVTSVTDPRNIITRYTLDGLGNQNQLDSPDTGTSANAYDAAGNLTSSTDARGKTTSYTYDALNRLVRIDYTGWPSTVFEYDGGASALPNVQGKLTKMTDESGNTTYSYDDFGRLIGKTQTVIAGASTNSMTLQYGYGDVGSATGKVASMTYPSGNRVNYSYDAAGRLNRMTLNPANANGIGTDTSTEVELLTDIAYAPFGRVQSWSWGGSTAAAPNTYSRTFDLDGRIASYNLGNALTTGTLRTLAYDAVSRITGYTHTGAATAPAPASLNQTFAYDGLDRLTQATASNSNQSYAYDVGNNRTSVTIGGSTYSNTVSSASNRLASTSGPLPVKTNAYDLAGNLLSDGTVNYVYSPRNRLQSSTAVGVTTTRLYNGLGQRVQRSGSNGLFAYDEAGHMVGEYDSATGAANLEIVYLGDMPVGVLKQRKVGNAPDQTLVSDVFYVYADHVDTPRLITRAQDGAIMWRWDLGDAFGLMPPNENPVNVGAFTFNLRMPGQYYDRETNLNYNMYRDYDPQTGRYIQSDPIGLKGGINTYSYVDGAPTIRTDFLGLDWVYSQSTGTLTHVPSDGVGPPQTIFTGGYSGHGVAVNNPPLDIVPGLGPIPTGTYAMGPELDNVTGSGHTLKGSIRLTPDSSNWMYGRGGFLIHGDNARNDKSASEGCIIVPRAVRDKMGRSSDKTMRVER